MIDIVIALTRHAKVLTINGDLNKESFDSIPISTRILAQGS